MELIATPRPPRHSVELAARCLGQLWGVGTADAQRIIDRIESLALDGEPGVSLMVRLNPPARVPERPERLCESDVRSREPGVALMWCNKCRTMFERKAGVGRPPKICPDCRGASAR